ncbi:Squalene/phytoene synthase-domain-containing protein [Daldinia vernicosa]|uniref:Squalene/phytoene synthase-domain-containing protein n=1 Tax=Daldinia vernicosa TaxID=114800 RepID=UPI0020080BCD|nr:Squalene/phytoene synthase-domain-containing protein [Daldinia vernicosa]KAI0847650.1 Squalene/phytoene synthase-domain-containing protein [Daldinia vernicosa]
MAYDYALVHLKYTIPPACILTFILKPLLTKLDLYKTFTLILVAFFATLPWDSYLIRHGVWTYPPDAIAGPRLFGIPAEELFFFVIQTYITSMLYILLSKPVLHAQFLTNPNDSSPKSRRIRTTGQALLIACIVASISLVGKGGRGTYFGLILIWACPVALLTWSLSGYFILNLPTSCVVVPIVLPTVYLWIVDELALGRGTWAIESGTKLGWRLWGSLELEEAVFFLFTNVLIVFGLVAFDRGLAVLYTFPELFPVVPEMPPPSLLAKAVLLDPIKYDMVRVKGIREAVQTLRRKSRSFYLASSVFPGRLRIDLVLLYSFCRVADDLIDEAHGEREATLWIKKLTNYLDHVYGSDNQPSSSMGIVKDFVEENFPESARSALILLPTKLLPSRPFYELLEGFKMDLSFGTRQRIRQFPIQDEEDLELYAHRVASTVGELCLRLVFHHSTAKLPSDKESLLVIAAQMMGHALQYVNIARDIIVDAEIGRVYLPSGWLKQEDLTPQDVIKDPTQLKVEMLRQKLLDWAFKEYERSRDTMSMLPHEVRGPLIVAVESYMEIGRVLRERTGVPSKTRKGRATVPRLRRIWVAWKNLSTV